MSADKLPSVRGSPCSEHSVKKVTICCSSVRGTLNFGPCFGRISPPLLSNLTLQKVASIAVYRH